MSRDNPVVAAVIVTLHNILCVSASEDKADKIAEEVADYMLEKYKDAEWQDLYLACQKVQAAFLRKASERLRGALGR
jgi:pyrimidine deaminase RibD-like protein